MLSVENKQGDAYGTVEPVSRDLILRRERGQGSINFSLFSADHEQDWQYYPVDPYICYNIPVCDDHTVAQTHVYT